VNFIREQLSQSGENISQGGEEISNIGEKISQTGEKFAHTYYLDNINNNKTKYVENLSADAAKTDVGGTEPERGKDPLYISGLSFSAPVGVAPVGVAAYKVEEVPSSDTSQRARAEEQAQTGAKATETGTAATEWNTYTNGTETTEQPPEMPLLDEPAPWDEVNRNWEDNTQPKEAEPTIEELQEKRETYHRAVKRLFAAMRMTSNKEQWERLNNFLKPHPCSPALTFPKRGGNITARRNPLKRICNPCGGTKSNWNGNHSNSSKGRRRRVCLHIRPFPLSHMVRQTPPPTG
jgi:hypothetical protein